MKPFENESEVITLGELSIENRLDKVSIFGTLDIQPDNLGLARAEAIREHMNEIITAIQKRLNDLSILPEEGPVNVGHTNDPFNN